MAEVTSKKKHRVRRIVLIVLAALVVLYGVGGFLITKAFYDSQFGRVERPEFTTYLRYENVQDQLPRTAVSFKSGANTLAGNIYGETNTKGLVVISHGLGGYADEYLTETLNFVQHGWRVLAYNNTGVLTSEGSSMIGLNQSLLDLDAALTWVESQPELAGLPLLLYGHSWGAYAACTALNFDHDVAAVVSMAGYNKCQDLFDQQGRAMAGLAYYALYPFFSAFNLSTFGSTLDLTAVGGINSSAAKNTQLMLLHGSNDEVIDVDTAATVAQRNQITNANVTVVIRSDYWNDGHNNLFTSQSAFEYREQVNANFELFVENNGGQSKADAAMKNQWADDYGLDRFKLNELDATLFEEINAFFDAATTG